MLNVKPSDSISVFATKYVFVPNPARPNMAHAIEGGRGIVYKVRDPKGRSWALKVPRAMLRTRSIEQSASMLKQYAVLDGLEVCDRQVITRQNSPDLLRTTPELEYSVLMPWIEGSTWQEHMVAPMSVNRDESMFLAQSLAAILAAMESRGLAHGDIAGDNIVIVRNGLVKDVHLVDVEEMYGPQMPQPSSSEMPAGKDGYQHREAATRSNWHPLGDRFAASVVIAEMLAWHDGQARSISSAQDTNTFFAQAELHDPASSRYQHVHSVIQRLDPRIARLFEQAWHSQRFEDCPSLADWKSTLGILGAEGSVSTGTGRLVQGPPPGATDRSPGSGGVATSSVKPPVPDVSGPRTPSKAIQGPPPPAGSAQPVRPAAPAPVKPSVAQSSTRAPAQPGYSQPYLEFVGQNVANFFMIAGLALMCWIVMAGSAQISAGICGWYSRITPTACLQFPMALGGGLASGLLGVSVAVGVGLIGGRLVADRKRFFSVFNLLTIGTLAFAGVINNWRYYFHFYDDNLYPGLLWPWFVLLFVGLTSFLLVASVKQVAAQHVILIPLLWVLPMALALMALNGLDLTETAMSVTSALGWIFTALMGPSYAVWLLSTLPGR